MKLKILIISANQYVIDIMDRWGETEITKELDLPLEDYQKILIDHGAYYHDDFNTDYHYRFKNLQDAEECIKTLEPYLIMKKLTEN